MSACYDIVAYDYAADRYCLDCMVVTATERMEAAFPGASARGDCDGFPDQVIATWARLAGIDFNDEHSYDSDEFPKVVFRDQLESEATCATCHCDLEDE